MKLIIDIPDRIHYGIETGITHNGSEACQIVLEAIKTGIPLDKIRAEIASLPNANPSYWHTCDVVEREEALEIIDKYRGEQE